jgi:hypothetical protein
MLKTLVEHTPERAVDAILDWRIEPLSGGWEATTSVYRLAGQAQAQEATLAWSLVLKIVRPTAERLDPAHWNYWQREPLAYQSGWLGSLPGGVAAPQVYAVVEQTDGSIWLWLESITDTSESPWPFSAFGVAAHQLGRFNGAYLMGRPLPTESWASRGWLRSYVEDYAPVVERLAAHQENALVRRAVPVAYLDKMLRLCAERKQLLAALEELPQTFCHLDAWRWNLFLTTGKEGEPRTMLVDWAFVGLGAIGQELAPLVYSNRREAAMEEYALARYLAGLHEAGWRGAEADVRLGYHVTMALSYGLALVGFYADALLDETQHAFLEAQSGGSMAEFATSFTAWMDFALPHAGRARELLGLNR